MKISALAWVPYALSTWLVGASPANRAMDGVTVAQDAETIKYTTFNGIKVPPLLEIKGPEFGETVKNGYW